jgi:ribosomal protein S6
MPFYQLTYLISPDIDQNTLESFPEKISTLIQKEGGIVRETKNPVKKRLGYQIKKKESAFLAVLNFEVQAEKINAIEKKLKGESDILRYLIIAGEPPKIERIPEKVFGPPAKAEKTKEEKVALQEIEKKLEEILGE